MKNLSNILLLALLLSFPFPLLEAQGVRIANSPGNPDPSAILDADATDKGFYPLG